MIFVNYQRIASKATESAEAAYLSLGIVAGQSKAGRKPSLSHQEGHSSARREKSTNWFREGRELKLW